jgi:hypothetical protein
MRITFNRKKVQKYLNPQIERSDTEFILRIPQHTPLSWIKNKLVKILTWFKNDTHRNTPNNVPKLIEH